MATHTMHLQAIAALALLEGKEEAYSLLGYASPSLREPLQIHLENSSAQSLQALYAQEIFSGISEIHPAWLLEALKKESPRVIGVILRHLPSKHVRYLLEHLPHQKVIQLPKLVEAFYVPNEILNLIRRRFERHFVPLKMSHQIQTFEFGHLYYLKIEELTLLFRELGLNELALSLVGGTKTILKAILNRFGLREAKEILSRVKVFDSEDKWLLNDAKYSILELGGEELGIESFLRELGLKALAKAFSRFDTFLFEALRQKLSPDNAHLLKRYLEEYRGPLSSEKITKRRTLVLSSLRKLNEEGKLDAIWTESLKEKAA
ncbi:MAG: hypothetical protein HY877_05815 [Deltaproteobacteria bacterium]|nr:hypothetical protein [Deltaproteobacteria bacterium]